MVTYLVLAAVVLVGAGVLVRVFARYARLRGTRVVTCPENQQASAVDIDAGRAALTGAFGAPRFELTRCTRWPEKADCGRECLAEISAAPVDCLVRTRLAAWYWDKTCVTCGREFGTVDWTQRQPGLLTPGGVTITWSDIQPEQIAEVLASHQPVCWDCHVTETFRRQHPELVLDNPWKKADNRAAGR